jgi:NADPH:quinone reductase
VPGVPARDRFLSAVLAVYMRMSIPATMRALEQRSLDGPHGLHLATETPVPRPGPGEVLIRVAAAGVNFVDVSRARGTFGDNPRPPFVAGFEAAGEVVAVGEGVSELRCGALVACAGPGAFAEYMIAPARSAMPVPAGWTAEQALGLVVNWPAALAGLELGRAAAGETVLVDAAAGATGQAAVVLAKRRGATVIAAASATKHDLVREHGADHVIDSRTRDLAATVRGLTDGRGADLAIHSAGGPAFMEAIAAVRRVTGRVVVIGLSGGNAAISNWDLVYKHPVQVIGFNLGALIQDAPRIFGEVMAELGGLIAAKAVRPARPTRYALADGSQALVDLETRATVGKLALVP